MTILFITLEESARQNLISITDNPFYKKNHKNIYTFGMSDFNLPY